MPEMLAYIHPQLRSLAIPINSVKPDPANARQHGAKNKLAISGSLSEFQQRKPIVVRQSTMMIEAGNGTWEQGRALGWTHIAAVICDDDDARAAAYALADNRTSDLSAWAKDNLASTLRTLRASKVPLDKLGFFSQDVAKRLAAKPPTADPNEMLRRFDIKDRAIMEGMAGFRTAQNRASTSVPMTYYREQGLLRGDVLDFGCGRDVPPVGVQIARYDPAYQPDLDALSRPYNTITLNYVLNVIPLEAHRAQVLLALRPLLAPGGQLLIAVYRKSEQDSKSASGYQCGWSPEEWEDLIGRWYEGERIPSSAGFLGWVCRPAPMVGMKRAPQESGMFAGFE